MYDDSWLKGYDSIAGDPLSNQDVWVIGGGPSLRNFDWHQLADSSVIATNEAFAVVPWAYALVFVDYHWWQKRQDAVREVFHGMVIGRGPYRSDYHRNGITALAYRSGEVWSIDPRLLAGRNSGLAAINVAWLMGAARIFLLGFDMHGIGGRHHFHNLYPDSPTGPAHRYDNIFIPEMIRASKAIEKHGRGVVINCTPGSALDCFPERSIEWALSNER